MIQNIKKKSKIEDLIKKYYKISKDENDYFMVLPLKSNENYDKNKKSLPYYGSQNDLTIENFIELETNNETIVYNKNKGTNKPYKTLISIINADAYEMRNRLSNYNIVVIDIDGINKNGDCTLEEYFANVNAPEIFKKLPYTLSRNKVLPHFYCIIEGLDNIKTVNNTYTECFKKFKGDLLFNHSWEIKDALLYNYNDYLPTIKWDEIRNFIEDETLNKIEETSSIKTIDLYNLPKDIQNEKKDFDNISEISDITTINEYEKPKQYDLQKIIKASKCFTKEWMNNQGNWYKFTSHFKKFFPNNIKEWDEICKLFPDRYDENENKKVWYNDKPSKTLHYASLLKFCKESNEELYNKLFKKNCIIDWSRLTEAEYARIMYDLYFKMDIYNNETDEVEKIDILIFTGNEKIADGYLFNKIYWSEVGKNMNIIKKGYFTKLYDYYKKELLKIKDELDEKEYNALLKKIQALDTENTREKVIKIIVSEHWRSFDDIKWNNNNNLFAFENKIYDLSIGCFIDPRPEQYINFTCGYNYIQDDYLEEKIEIEKFCKSIVKDDNEKDYILKVFSTFLIQENKEEKAYFMTGVGRNGKGTLTTLTANAIGKYWGNLNIEYFTQYDKSPDSPNQQLFDNRYSRVINTSEISDENKKFLSDKFLRMTGGDVLKPRSLGDKKIIEFKAGKVLIQTNTLPKFSKNTIALKERIEIIYLPFTFTCDQNLLKDTEKYKPIDNNLKTKFNTERYRSAFISVLFDYYKKYKLEGLNNKPNSILEETKKYFCENEIKNFFYETYRKATDIELEQMKKENKTTKTKISDIRDFYAEICEKDVKSISCKTFVDALDDLKEYITKEKGYYHLHLQIIQNY